MFVNPLGCCLENSFLLQIHNPAKANKEVKITQRNHRVGLKYTFFTCTLILDMGKEKIFFVRSLYISWRVYCVFLGQFKDVLVCSYRNSIYLVNRFV